MFQFFQSLDHKIDENEKKIGEDYLLSLNEKEDEINNFINEDLENVYAEFSDDEEWKREGYLYKEESPDYDEENPDGDCVDY